MSISPSTVDHFKASDRRSFNLIALALAVAVLVGFAVLPRLASSRHALVGKPAPDFNLPVIQNGEQGDRIQLSNLQGQPVVLAFWASWCPPCRAEAPAVDRLSRRLRDKGVPVLGINMNDPPANAVSFARRARLSYPILSDEAGKVGAAFGISSLPTIVVVDSSGNVVGVRSGLSDSASLEALVLSAR